MENGHVNRSKLTRRQNLKVNDREQVIENCKRGYMEMARINLNIALESFQLEEEADGTLDRLVSGV